MRVAFLNSKGRTNADRGNGSFFQRLATADELLNGGADQSQAAAI